MIVLLFAASYDWETVKNVSHETVHCNRIKLVSTLFIYLILKRRYSEATKARQRLMIFVYVMRYLRRVPRDWETVKTVSHETVHRNRIKLVATEKGVKQSEMFNNSVYSRLGNN